jgi:hypothetical protein
MTYTNEEIDQIFAERSAKALRGLVAFQRAFVAALEEIQPKFKATTEHLRQVNLKVSASLRRSEGATDERS